MSLMYRVFLAREFWPLARGAYRAVRLVTPTLLLFGTRDYFFPPRALAGHEPYADDLRVELLEDAGHFLPEENPELVSARALEFLASVGASAGQG
jgi:pimeloyl-ACP methyl ester carboxylesterase